MQIFEFDKKDWFEALRNARYMILVLVLFLAVVIYCSCSYVDVADNTVWFDEPFLTTGNYVKKVSLGVQDDVDLRTRLLELGKRVEYLEANALMLDRVLDATLIQDIDAGFFR